MSLHPPRRAGIRQKLLNSSRSTSHLFIPTEAECGLRFRACLGFLLQLCGDGGGRFLCFLSVLSIRRCCIRIGCGYARSLCMFRLGPFENNGRLRHCAGEYQYKTKLLRRTTSKETTTSKERDCRVYERESSCRVRDGRAIDAESREKQKATKVKRFPRPDFA